MIIYKVFLQKEYEKFIQQGFSQGSKADKRDGFIHFSTGSQLDKTLDLHFSEVQNICILSFNTDDIPKLLWEKSRNEELFPHGYGKIYSSDFIRKIQLKRTNGKFKIPEGFLNNV